VYANCYADKDTDFTNQTQICIIIHPPNLANSTDNLVHSPTFALPMLHKSCTFAALIEPINPTKNKSTNHFNNLFYHDKLYQN
jgi:hypothetical protein